MKLIICSMAFLCLKFPAYSQTPDTQTSLFPGQYMPDVSINNIVNSKNKSAKISDFKGKILILDFWATTCGGCIQSMPEMDSLQQVYKNRINILLVDSEKFLDDERKVMRMLDIHRSWTRKKFSLPIAIGDTAITNKFKFRGIPYVVWISQNGQILALTGKPEVTPENIERALAGEKLIAVDNNDKRVKL
ncbi:TlpA family protein disulfide reductase [Mucilaginibacter sp. SJ]|uniref:TlpA family protein disulfide reductase n=1 Tax=Mucilaginibacter sp. SJ TaxID=3029053 RepID=UPI0023A9C177|nr:TlpA disulfide reductase family protein [Mucilaginibacter sp. SJ]WEA01752.1 TlpA disulfide reductase family protein [Mucilaginibacter sp. SJ]